MNAQVIAFPRACSQCTWVAHAGSDLFCLTFRQMVAEFDAKDCEAYEPDGCDR